MSRRILSMVCVGALAACAPAAAPVADPAPAMPAPPPADAGAIPAMTELALRLDNEMPVELLTVGQTFTVQVQDALVATNGAVVIPENAVVTGMVTGVKPTPDADAPAAVRINFLRINIEGASHPFPAEIAAAHVPGSVVDAGATLNPGTPATPLGTVITGDLRDALVRGPLGSGAGTIISLGAGDVQPTLPTGTLLTVRVRDTIQLRS